MPAAGYFRWKGGTRATGCLAALRVVVAPAVPPALAAMVAPGAQAAGGGLWLGGGTVNVVSSSITVNAAGAGAGLALEVQVAREDRVALAA